QFILGSQRNDAPMIDDSGKLLVQPIPTIDERSPVIGGGYIPLGVWDEITMQTLREPERRMDRPADIGRCSLHGDLIEGRIVLSHERVEQPNLKQQSYHHQRCA